jgi:hypothetical protein
MAELEGPPLAKHTRSHCQVPRRAWFGRLIRRDQRSGLPIRADQTENQKIFNAVVT